MIIRTYELMISVRFLLKGRLQTILILFGIAAGVAVQFFLAALIGGLQISLIDKTVGTAPHILILPADSIPMPIANQNSGKDKIIEYQTGIYKENTEILNWREYVNFFKAVPEFISVSPVVSGQRFIVRGDINNTVLVKGITFPDGANIYKFNKNIKSGNPDITGNNVIIGNTLSEKLKLSIGDKFYMISGGGGSGDFFIVSAIIDLGSAQGNNIVITTLDRARNFLSVEGVTSIEIQIDDVFQADILADKIRNEFKRVKIESWIERNKELLTALRSQSSSSNIIQFFILFSISLGIASVLGIAAAQKSKQLGILKAMGVDNKGAAFIFLIQGLILGFIGSIIGIIIGLGLGFMFMKFAGAAGFGLELTIANIITPVIFAILASGLASIIPARSAGKLTPIEVIRNG
jgi:lipoprotein-releasing system permease protein